MPLVAWLKIAFAIFWFSLLRNLRSLVFSLLVSKFAFRSEVLIWSSHQIRLCFVSSMKFSRFMWWRRGESNSWPPACKAGALPAELRPHEHISFSFSQLCVIRRPAPRRTQVQSAVPSSSFLDLTEIKRNIHEIYNRQSISIQKLVGLRGLGPLTSRLSGVRSNQLSYRPMDCLRVKPSKPNIVLTDVRRRE